MEQLMNYSDISLIPSEVNSGIGKYNYAIQDTTDRVVSLPIFTSPIYGLVSEENWRIWSGNGIRPILPRTVSLDLRLEGCQYTFAAFSLKEVNDCFLSGKRSSAGIFKICVDSGNGHDTKIFEVAQKLKSLYGPQVNLMGGNIGSPKVYGRYCNSGFDYVRVGMASGSLVNIGKYGFYYPQASLLLEIMKSKNTSFIGKKHTKIIADGGIESFPDILKAIALGADYVMIGRDFMGLVEASGPIWKKEDGTQVENPEILLKMTPSELRELKLFREYYGNTHPHVKALQGSKPDVHDWVSTGDCRRDEIKVTRRLEDWMGELYECLCYGFTMAGATDWASFKNNIKFVRI